MNTQKLKSKIALKLPLTPQEYSFAVLYLGLNPDAYIQKTTKLPEYITTQEVRTNLPRKIDHTEKETINFHIHFHL